MAQKFSEADMAKRMEERKELIAAFGAEDHKAVPLFEDAPWYPEDDLVELYWLDQNIIKCKDKEKRAELIKEFAKKRDSIRKLPSGPERIYLWPEDKPVPGLTNYTDNSAFQYNHDPDFRPYFYEMLIPEDITPKGIIVFVAGGDHGWSMFHEAYQSCRDFNALGYQTILVANRTNNCPWEAVDAAADASRVIRLVRKNAGKYRVNPNQVVYAGFSNGGVTGENVIRYFSGEKKMTDYYPDYVPDEADNYYGAPDAFLCVYGPRWVGHEFDFTGVKYPPTFFAIGREDSAIDNFNYVYPQLLERGVPVEIHTFAGAPHGVAGLSIVDRSVRYPNFELWIPLADYFIQDVFK